MKHAQIQIKSMILMAETHTDVIKQANELLLKENEKMLVKGRVSMFWESQGDITYQSTTRLYFQPFFLYRIIEVLD